MAVGTPRSLSAFCRTVLPHLVAATDKRRLLKTAAEVVGTDRWNSFDRFHETTRTLVRHYEHSGAKAEVEAIQTGSRIGTGRWIIQGAQDVVAAPVRHAYERDRPARLGGQTHRVHPFEVRRGVLHLDPDRVEPDLPG